MRKPAIFKFNEYASGKCVKEEATFNSMKIKNIIEWQYMYVYKFMRYCQSNSLRYTYALKVCLRQEERQKLEKLSIQHKKLSK